VSEDRAVWQQCSNEIRRRCPLTGDVERSPVRRAHSHCDARLAHMLPVDEVGEGVRGDAAEPAGVDGLDSAVGEQLVEQASPDAELLGASDTVRSVALPPPRAWSSPLAGSWSPAHAFRSDAGVVDLVDGPPAACRVAGELVRSAGVPLSGEGVNRLPATAFAATGNQQ
jgi:hypothetical protein